MNLVRYSAAYPTDAPAPQASGCLSEANPKGRKGPCEYAAVAEFGAPVSEMKPEEFAQYGMIFQIGVAPCRVDIISKISGVSYADAVNRAVPKTIDGVPVRIISLDDLIANKKASGRTKDIADVEVLEGLRK